MPDQKKQKRDEVAVVGLISTGHFFSHFYLFAIPSVLTLMQAEMGASFTLMGVAMAVYSVCSAVGQYPMGVMADKFGARYLVIGGLFVEALAVGLMGLAPNIFVVIGLAVVAGIADSVFHPADYAVITARVRNEWLGKSYALHTFSGFLGFAAMPSVMLVLLPLFDWRTSLMIVGSAGIAWAFVMLLQRSLLGQESLEEKANRTGPAKTSAPEIGIRTFLAMPAIMLMFFFYAATSLAGNGIQAFSVPALSTLYHLTAEITLSGLAGYSWGIAAGILAGGIVADRINRFDLISIVGYLIAGAALCITGIAVVPFAAAIVAMVFAGFMIGLVMPSRDVMVKTVTPPGAAGKAFGFVSTGFGIGGFIGPLLYGTIMDSGHPAALFYTAAFLMLVTIGFAVAAGRYVRPKAVPQPAE
ncbi:MAG: MFS transporter [Proteobacteria bacterium]|nr:MFS transporter [Pseudomonadota bacterium]